MASWRAEWKYDHRLLGGCAGLGSVDMVARSEGTRGGVRMIRPRGSVSGTGASVLESTSLLSSTTEVNIRGTYHSLVLTTQLQQSGSTLKLGVSLRLQHTALPSMSTSITGASSREPTQRRLKTRPTSSAVLWGHLLSNNDVSRTASSSRNAEGASATALATITPVDKTGTSLRILLHDTQANLEKFSERVGKLTGDIDESKREIGAAKALLQQDHEKTVEEIVDLGEWPAYILESVFRLRCVRLDPLGAHVCSQ